MEGDKPSSTSPKSTLAESTNSSETTLEDQRPFGGYLRVEALPPEREIELKTKTHKKDYSNFITSSWKLGQKCETALLSLLVPEGKRAVALVNSSVYLKV